MLCPPRIVSVLLPQPLPEPFDYELPEGMEAAPGSFVVAPLGPRASVHEDLDGLVAAVVREARPGDHVFVMSNGGFGGVHGKLLGVLQAREVAQGRKASG